MRNPALPTLLALIALGVPASAQAPTLGQRGHVVGDTTVIVASSGGVVRKQKAGSPCMLAAGSTVEFVTVVAGSSPQQMVVKRVVTPTVKEATDAAKKSVTTALKPGAAGKRFMDTCGPNRHVFIPADVFTVWLAAQRAEDAKREAEKAVRGKKG